MARPLRIEYEGAVYHITSRGNARQDIFLGSDDRTTFLKILGDVVERYNWICHAYCLMTNHYHLLIETPDANLSRGMQQLNAVYTQAFNRRHHLVGHVLQGRYKAILVEKETHLLELVRYIALNPVRAKLVSRPRDWRWSSYRATSRQSESPRFLTTDWILSQFHHDHAKAAKEYRKFVKDGYGIDVWGELRGGVILGTEGFAEGLKPLLWEKSSATEIPRSERLAVRPRLEELFAEVKDKPARNERIYQAVRAYGYTLKEVAEFIGLHYSTVSIIASRRAAKSRQAQEHQKQRSDP